MMHIVELKRPYCIAHDIWEKGYRVRLLLKETPADFFWRTLAKELSYENAKKMFDDLCAAAAPKQHRLL